MGREGGRLRFLRTELEIARAPRGGELGLCGVGRPWCPWLKSHELVRVGRLSVGRLDRWTTSPVARRARRPR